MPGNPYNHVNPGDDLQIPAAAWNTLVDIARFARTGVGPAKDTFRQATIVRVKNESGADLDRFAILGLGDPLFTPQDASEDAFLREVTFRGAVPDIDKHKRRFCVTLEPAPDGRIVRAYVAGVCPAFVDVQDPSHEYAGIADGDRDALLSSRYGFAQILWREGDEAYGYGSGYDTGIQWAIVRLGATCPSVAIGKAHGTISPRTGSTFGTGTVDLYRDHGGTADGPLGSVDVKNPGTVISGGKYVSVGWDMDGTAFVAPLECE